MPRQPRKFVHRPLASAKDRIVRSRRPEIPLVAGVFAKVRRRAKRRERRDKGHVGRSGEVIRVSYSVGDDTRVLMMLDATPDAPARREWFWVSEVVVVARERPRAAA